MKVTSFRQQCTRKTTGVHIFLHIVYMIYITMYGCLTNRIKMQKPASSPLKLRILVVNNCWSITTYQWLINTPYYLPHGQLYLRSFLSFGRTLSQKPYQHLRAYPVSPHTDLTCKYGSPYTTAVFGSAFSLCNDTRLIAYSPAKFSGAGCS